MINFKNLKSDYRCTRTVIGRSNSIDVSCVIDYETNYITGEVITESDFDNDFVIHISDCGFTTVSDLMKCCVYGVRTKTLSDPIFAKDFIHKYKIDRMFGK